VNQLQRTNESLFVNEGTKINPEATLADLVSEVFYDPMSNASDIRAQVLGVVDDDLTLLIFAMEGADDADVPLWQRALHRIQYKIKLADELAKRIKLADEFRVMSEAAE
jgi:hypothetical protein